MEQKEINKLILELDWNNSKDIQLQAINALLKINSDHLNLLLQNGEKSCWENEALVISKIGYPQIKKIIPNLFDWLQDLNWPGALTILDTLKRIDIKILKPYIEKAIEEAAKGQDDLWMMAIKQLVNLTGLNQSDFDKSLYDQLLKYSE